VRKKDKKVPGWFLAENYKLIRSKSNNLFVYIQKDDDLYRKLTATSHNYVVDERCNLLSFNNVTSNLEFIYNYAETNAFMANMPDMFNVPDESSTKNELLFEAHENKTLKRQLSLGFIPIIFLPTNEVSVWTPDLLSRLDYLQNNKIIEYTRLPSSSFISNKMLRTYDYWISRLDLAKFISLYGDKKVTPEQVRMVDAVKTIFRIN